MSERRSLIPDDPLIQKLLVEVLTQMIKWDFRLKRIREATTPAEAEKLLVEARQELTEGQYMELLSRLGRSDVSE